MLRFLIVVLLTAIVVSVVGCTRGENPLTPPSAASGAPAPAPAPAGTSGNSTTGGPQPGQPGNSSQTATPPQQGVKNPPTGGGVQAVPPGTTLPSGQRGVFENVDHGKKMIDIWAPTLGQTWTTGTQGPIDHNGWIGYNNDADAMTGACSLVQERSTEDWAKGYNVTLNGGKSCSQAAAPQIASPVVKAAKGGMSLPAGTLVVLENVNNNARTVDVKVTTLTETTRFDVYGMVHINGWYDYGSAKLAKEGACQEAQERLSEARITNSWNQGYRVTLEGGTVPDVCPQPAGQK